MADRYMGKFGRQIDRGRTGSLGRGEMSDRKTEDGLADRQTGGSSVDE